MKNTQRGPMCFIALFLIAIIGIGVYAYKNNRQKSQVAADQQQVVATPESKLTPEQIFSEVSAAEGFHSKLDYFRVYGQDRVEFKLAGNPESVFAYRFQGGWLSRGGTDCSAYDDFAEQYRPACYDSATKANKYVDAKGESINYPRSLGVSYIGQ